MASTRVLQYPALCIDLLHLDFVESVPGLIREPHAVVRIPSHTLRKSKEPFSACILRTSTCRSITNTPGFYTPLPPQNPDDVVFTKYTSDMGAGLFVKRNFKVNEVIFSERPLLVFPSGLPISSSLPKDEAKKCLQLVYDDTLQQALRAMTMQDADAFMSLSNSQLDLPQASGIVNTNAYGTDIDKEKLQEGQFEYSAVGMLASRINHRCV